MVTKRKNPRITQPHGPHKVDFTRAEVSKAFQAVGMGLGGPFDPLKSATLYISNMGWVDQVNIDDKPAGRRLPESVVNYLSIQAVTALRKKGFLSKPRHGRSGNPGPSPYSWASARNGKWHRTVTEKPSWIRDEIALCGITFRPVNVTWNEEPPTTEHFKCKHCLASDTAPRSGNPCHRRGNPRGAYHVHDAQGRCITDTSREKAIAICKTLGPGARVWDNKGPLEGGEPPVIFENRTGNPGRYGPDNPGNLLSAVVRAWKSDRDEFRYGDGWSPIFERAERWLKSGKDVADGIEILQDIHDGVLSDNEAFMYGSGWEDLLARIQVFVDYRARRPNAVDDEGGAGDEFDEPANCCVECKAGPPEAPWCALGSCDCHHGGVPVGRVANPSRYPRVMAAFRNAGLKPRLIDTGGGVMAISAEAFGCTVFASGHEDVFPETDAGPWTVSLIGPDHSEALREWRPATIAELQVNLGEAFREARHLYTKETRALSPRAGNPYDDEDQDEGPTCPMCSGPGVPLGTLGRLEHFRCRNCGHDFSRKV